MKWNQYTIHTTEEAEDLVLSMLYDLGITNVEVKDSLPVMDEEDLKLYEDVMPVLEESDGSSDIVFYTSDEEDAEALLSQVREGLEELKAFVDTGDASITEEETEDKDWVNNWKEHFSAFMVDDVLIKPTWVDMPEDMPHRLMVEIDPGTAFGTGSHETTKLVIHGMKKYLKPGDRVLDVGTGSGILGIIALKSGASYALGTDIDELAVEAAEENIAVNGLEKEQFSLILGDILTEEKVQKAVGDECFDMAVANILADVIIPLQKEVVRHIKPGGILITSGIINLKEEAVREALLANPALTITDTLYEGEWVSFIARKN